MIPILYEATETAFTSQGLGALTDAVSCKISRVINGKDELVMVYPNTGARYADLSNDRIILAQPEYKKTAQPYQIYQITKPLNGLVSVYARQACAQRMPYIPVSAFSASTLTATLNALPQHLAEANPFTFWTNKSVTADFSLTKPASLGNVLGGMDGSILDVYGGEYEFDRYTIKLWDRRGVNSGVELRYAKNITDIEHDEDVSAIVTGVCPYWEDMDGTVVVLPELVVEGTYADAYPFRRSIVRDFSSDFDEQPTVADLRAAATAYVAQAGLGVPTISLKVSFEHLAQYTGYENLQLLETLNLGDTVSIIYEPLNVTASARIAKTTYDCLNEKYVSVQVGSIKTDLEQVISQTNNAVSQIKDNVAQFVPSVIAAAVEHATEIITGVNGGYVVLHMDANDQPYELLIMNTPDIQTATNVWRFNQNGLGHSSTGYNGTYGLALTADGQIVADKITTGTLDCAGITVTHLDGSSINANSIVLSSLASETKAAFATSAATQIEYYLSSSSSSATGGSWSTTIPTWTNGKYIWTRTKNTVTNGNSVVSTSYVPSANGMYDSALTTALSTASSAASAASGAQTTADSALVSAVPLYYRSTTSTAPAKPTQKIESTSTGSGVWTLAMPQPARDCYFWTCNQYQFAGGTYGWSDVRAIEDATYASKWCAANDSTYIDGGRIYTGSVTADRIKANETFTQTLYAQDFHINGGSVNIQTASETNDIIQLSSGNYTARMQPYTVLMENTSSSVSAELRSSGVLVMDNDALRSQLSSGLLQLRDADSRLGVQLATGATGISQLVLFGKVNNSNVRGVWAYADGASSYVNVYDTTNSGASAASMTATATGGQVNVYDTAEAKNLSVDAAAGYKVLKIASNTETVVASLWKNNNGGLLNINDSSGNNCFQINKSGLNFYNGTIRADIAVSGSDNGLIHLYDTNAVMRTTLSAVNFYQYDASGNTRFNISTGAITVTDGLGVTRLTTSTAGGVNLYNSIGNTCVMLTPNNDYGGALAARSLSGNNRVHLGVDSGDTGHVYVYDSGNTARAKLTHENLTFYNANGTLTATYPGTGFADYVTETGTSSSWYYRKWNSGKCELWRRVTRSKSAIGSTAWGSLYVGNLAAVAYPFTFSSVPYEYVSPAGYESGTSYTNSFWICNAGGTTGATTTQSGQYQAVRATDFSAGICIDYYVCGTLA